jgi:hypothetical protein
MSVPACVRVFSNDSPKVSNPGDWSMEKRGFEPSRPFISRSFRGLGPLSGEHSPRSNRQEILRRGRSSLLDYQRIRIRTSRLVAEIIGGCSSLVPCPGRRFSGALRTQERAIFAARHTPFAPLVIGFSAILVTAENWCFEASCEIRNPSYTCSCQLCQLFTLLIRNRSLVTEQAYQLLHFASRGALERGG